ncbi:protein YIF1A-like [Adelges cooleyi]|uniref:protein YIF1A-like n=1 Tax=Adelges cooleyi TaxID=133065 RepID=UPI0021800D08|nr:protein YIF1A-like [Adelges cooleyi]
MSFNDNRLNLSSGNRRLTRRPMETPGLDTKSPPMAAVPPTPTPQPYYHNQQSPQYEPQQFAPQQQFYYNDFTPNPSAPQHGYGQQNFAYSGPSPMMDGVQQRPNYPPSPGLQVSPQQVPSNMFIPTSNFVDAFGGNPLLAGATVKYGQKILGQVVDDQVGKYTSGFGAQIKRYFAVDTRYVISKLTLLIFPFARTDWSIVLETTGEHNGGHQRVGPKTDINAPDLYIPTVSFITYLLLLGLILGKHNQFSPEMLSVHASRALAWEMFVVTMEMLTLYVINIQSSLRTLDLTSYSGYKYFGIVVCVPFGLMFGETAFYISLLYSSVAFMYFLLFSMRCQLNSSVSDTNNPVVMIEYKRKRTLYFLILAVVIQPITTWFLVSNLTFSMRQKPI